MNPHQIVDLAVLGVLIFCAVKGASRGLLSQLAWVVALLLCFKFAGTLAPAIEPMIGVAPPLKQWIAMLLVYVGLCLLSFIAAGMLSSWMEKAKVIDFDKHLGGVLGFVKGIVICLTAMFFAITMSEPMRQIVSKTYSGYAAATILHHSQYLIPLLPEHSVPTVQKVIDEFNRRLQPIGDDLGGATPADPGDFGYPAADGIEEPFDLTRLLPTRDRSMKSEGTDLQVESETGPNLQDLLREVPSALRRELTQKALDTLANSTVEEKQRLLDQLSNNVPEDAAAILKEFFRSTTGSGQGIVTEKQADTRSLKRDSSLPARPPSNGRGTTVQLGRTESGLLNEIAEIYSQRSDIVANTKQHLAGVPASVQRQVLEDWHSDALGLIDDPDRSTDVNTRLDDRILRQLRRAGISLNGLDRDLRDRLSDSMGYDRR
ncbi:MAG: CvpA family protein [Planctomycetota bacterium]